MSDRIESCALHVICFAPLHSGPDDRGGMAHLQQLWQRCDALGFDTGHPHIATTETFPPVDELGDDWYQVLAARGSTEQPDATAVLFTAHDAIGAAIRLPGGDDWAELTNRWRASVDDGDDSGDIFGEVHVYSATFAGAPDALPVDCEPAALRHLRWVVDKGDIELGVVVQPGIGVWEREGEGERTWVVVAPSGEREVLERWLEPTAQDLPRLGRYLLHASKLRYEVGVFQRSFAAVRARERAVDAALEELLAMGETIGVAARPAEMARVEEVLDRTRRESTALLISVTRLRDLQQTMEIACHNVDAYRPALEDGGDTTRISPFDRDAELGGWLAQQIGHELGYLASVRERAQEAQHLTSFHVERASEAHARVLNRLTMLQTSVLGALLAGVAVIGTFGSPFDVRDGLRLPILALVMAVALALPPVVVRWYEPYGLFELAGSAAVGGSAAWLVAALADRSVAPAVSMAAAAAGAVAASAALARVNRRTSRAP